MALGVLAYYAHQYKTPKETPVNQTNETLVNQSDITPANKYLTDWAIRMDKKSKVNDLYQVSGHKHFRHWLLDFG